MLEAGEAAVMPSDEPSALLKEDEYVSLAAAAVERHGGHRRKGAARKSRQASGLVAALLVFSCFTVADMGTDMATVGGAQSDPAGSGAGGGGGVGSWKVGVAMGEAIITTQDFPVRRSR